MDLDLPGVKSEAALMSYIFAASDNIDRAHQFIPRLETIKFSACGASELLVPPLLAITSITSDGIALAEGTDYVLKPYERLWRNGPYTRICLNLYGYFSTLPEGVAITGRWGLYEATKSLGANITTGSASDTALSVTDGSAVSPGMVLLVESEQILVVATSGAINSTATISADLEETDEEITVSDGTQLHVGETIKIDFEQLRVLDISANTIQARRGWNGSKSASHLTGAAINVYRTFEVKRGVNGTVASTHTGAAAYQYKPPEDVNYLCRQMAALMLKKAQTGFMGRSGNDDLGTGFWVNEFPKNQIEAVMSNYPWFGA
jgi:hypothetical protein